MQRNKNKVGERKIRIFVSWW